MKIKYLIIWGVISSFLYGCSVNSYLTIDVLKPAKQPILQKSADVALITDVFNPEKCGQYYVYDKRSVFDSTCRVRLQAEIFMEGIEDIIAESQFFTNVANIGVNKKNMPFSDMLLLSQDAVPDILLVLNDFTMKDETYFVPSIYGGYGVMRGTFITSLLFYDVASQSLLGQKTLLDTVYWVSQEIYPNEFVYLERNREYILKYLAHEAGKKVATYFFPAWASVTRVLIVSQGKEAQRASEAALADSWERANYFWEALSKEKNKKTQSAAWFNRAVYQEVNGDFETAVDYIKRADALRHRKIHRVYLDVLEQRIGMQRQFESLMLDDEQ
jgi:hypothetical protein